MVCSLYLVGTSVFLWIEEKTFDSVLYVLYNIDNNKKEGYSNVEVWSVNRGEG